MTNGRGCAEGLLEKAVSRFISIAERSRIQDHTLNSLLLSIQKAGDYQSNAINHC